jgi:hypothetical protein
LKQTTAKTTTTFQQKQKNQTGETNRRHARLITNIPNEQESKKETNPIETSSYLIKQQVTLNQMIEDIVQEH